MTKKELNTLRNIVPTKSNDSHDDNKKDPWVEGSLEALRQAREL